MHILVLISGNGTNLQAMIDAKIPIAAVISNEPNAYGLTRAKKANIPWHLIDHRQFKSRLDFENALQKQIDVYCPRLIVLSGFMRRLGTAFIQRYAGRIINIHPSLLPKYPGLQTHQKVLKNHDQEHGTSIHFVTEKLDAGPLIAQQKLTVGLNETEESLKRRVQALEHQLYPRIIQLFLQNRIQLKGEVVFLDKKPLIDENKINRT